MASNMNPQDDSSSRKVEEARDLLQEIKDRARQAHETGNIFMMNIYQSILKVASPIVIKALARAEREELADLNKAHKDLRQQVRENAASEA